MTPFLHWISKRLFYLSDAVKEQNAYIMQKIEIMIKEKNVCPFGCAFLFWKKKNTIFNCLKVNVARLSRKKKKRRRKFCLIETKWTRKSKRNMNLKIPVRIEERSWKIGGIEPDTSCLPVFRAEPLFHWWNTKVLWPCSTK